MSATPGARRVLLFSLLAVAAWLAFFGDKTPSDKGAADVVQPAATPAAGAVARVGSGASGVLPRTLPAARPAAPSGRVVHGLEVAALTPREELIPALDEKREGGDLFPALSWNPPPPKPEKPSKPPKPPPPVAPPLPFVYLGKKLEGGQWEAYLGRGEEVFIAREGAMLAGDYQVTSVRPPSLTLLYLPLKQSQNLSIGESP